ncbi:MAG TPA: MarR family transcriptional regulator [Candidatus Limiplasma sp.]|nr:MarR family transcriptional regulator [Candidatus Limiplasma sp.]
MAMDAFDRELNQLLVMAYRKINKLEEGILHSVSGMDLSISEMHLLEAIGEKKGEGVPLYELAQRMELSAPTVTVAINKLTKKGFVVKCKSEKDRRSVIVELTRLGKKMDAAHRYFHEKMVRDINKLLTPDEREGMLKGMTELNQFFQAALDDMEEKKQQQRAQL